MIGDYLQQLILSGQAVQKTASFIGSNGGVIECPENQKLVITGFTYTPFTPPNESTAADLEAYSYQSVRFWNTSVFHNWNYIKPFNHLDNSIGGILIESIYKPDIIKQDCFVVVDQNVTFAFGANDRTAIVSSPQQSDTIPTTRLTPENLTMGGLTDTTQLTINGIDFFPYSVDVSRLVGKDGNLNYQPLIAIKTDAVDVPESIGTLNVDFVLLKSENV